MTEGHCFYVEHKYTLAERFWRALGFHHPPTPQFSDDELPHLAAGHITVTTVVCCDWKDRLRVLFGGVVIVAQAVKTDVVVATAVTRANIGVARSKPWA